MKTLVRCLLAVTVFSFVAIPNLVKADDAIDPDSISMSMQAGESFSIEKTVTVGYEPSTTSPVDVFLLTDSTGSMGGIINTVKTSASAILSSAAGLGDVQFGVGEYRDIYDAFTYRMNTDITADTAAVQAGINAWYAGGGGDWQEAQMFALYQVATTASWRPGSTRILVWFGDAPGHDPRNGISMSQAIAALNLNSISVESINVGYYSGGLDAYGQATAISAATGGTYYSGISTSEIVATIQEAITVAVNTYSSVDLDVSEAPDGMEVTATEGYLGTWERDVDRDFVFDVTFTALEDGEYDFNIYALVDGGRVATEHDVISVVSVCDVDESGQVDIADIQAIFSAIRQPATGPDDPRDYDGDGVISVVDARACVLQCANPQCAP